METQTVVKSHLTLDILTKTFDDLPTGVGIFYVPDLDDIKSIQYVHMNKVILYEMRKTSEEVQGKKIIEVAPEAFEHEGGLFVMETYRRIAANGGSVNLGLVEYSNEMVAGIYECSVHFIQEGYVYVMLRNVTDLEQKKNELEIKNQELSQFAYTVSHDLKSPLNSISSLVPLIRTNYKGKFDDKTNEMFGFIAESTERMRVLIDDVLDYSRIGRKKEMVNIDCQKLVSVIQQDLQARIKNTNATIEVGKLPTIKGYETELRLLFQNLISNGIKFCKPDVAPRISITAEEKDGWTFRVKDNGIGIEDKYKEKIFMVFERLHSTSEYEGTGIGLAHCKKIVELHNGTIWVKSEPGKGSTFAFTIPTKAKEA